MSVGGGRKVEKPTWTWGAHAITHTDSNIFSGLNWEPRSFEAVLLAADPPVDPEADTCKLSTDHIRDLFLLLCGSVRQNTCLRLTAVKRLILH